MAYLTFYNALLTSLPGLVVRVADRLLFLPADGDCVHEVHNAAHLIVTGEMPSSMQGFLQKELARRLGDQAAGNHT